MNYYWAKCPGCSCDVTVQFVERPDGLSGSVRRWSADRSVNDGRPLTVGRDALSSDGGFTASCVCGTALPVRAADVERATTERPAG